MKITVLLMEDDPTKKNRLLEFLGNEKDIIERLDIALCANDAGKFLAERQYDLFVADIVVPQTPGGVAHEDHAIALFQQLDDGFGDLKRPTYSLPISASSSLSNGAHDFFVGRPWGILAYSDSNDEFLTTVEKICTFVGAQKAGTRNQKKCDVFVVSALMEPEFSAVERLALHWSALEPLDSSQLIRYGRITIDSRVIVIAAAFCQRMGPVSAAVLTTKAVLKLKPSLVVMVGICAGIPKKAAIGDVVSPDMSWDWQSGKYTDKNGNEIFEIAPHQLSIDDATRNQLLMFKRDTEFWNSLAPLAIGARVEIPKLLVGPMATGSSVLADSRVIDRIKSNQHKNVTGLDMEIYGVFSAVAACDPGIKFMAMKSVCDLGDVKKNDKYQAYAANVAASAFMRFLEKFSSPLLT